jgi:trk system potassium uptake protein TrkA
MYRHLYEAFNLQVVSATSWAAQRMEELVYHSDLRTVFSAGNGEVELYEVPISKSWHNQKIGKLLGNQSCIAVSITRIGRSFIPTVETILEKGDVVLIAATLEGIENLRKRAGLHQEEA